MTGATLEIDASIGPAFSNQELLPSQTREGISAESASEESASVFALRHAPKVSSISVDESGASTVSPVLFA